MKLVFSSTPPTTSASKVSSSLSLAHSLGRCLLQASGGGQQESEVTRVRLSTTARSQTKQPPKERRRAKEKRGKRSAVEGRNRFHFFFFFFRRSRTRQTRKRACGCPARSLRAWARAAPGSRCARSAPQARRALCMVRRCAERRSKKNSRRFKIGQPPCHCRTSPRKRDSVLIDFYFLPLFSNYSRRKKSSLRHERGLHF